MAQGPRIAPTRSLGRIHVSLVVVITGSLLVGGSLIARPVDARSPRPGRLVAKNPEALWMCPEQSKPEGLSDGVPAFEIVNTGHAPVYIRGVETSCGCTEADVQPRTIAPGRNGFVKVKVTPIPVGERAVAISLLTDSPLTPNVNLSIRVVGSRHPPFLLAAYGDLTYLDDPSAEEPRELTAICVEIKGTPVKPPTLETELPFLSFGPPTIDEQPYFDPRTVSRKYTFRATFGSSSPPKDLFSGEVWVTDPWDTQRRERILVSGRTIPALRVIPSRLIVRSRPAGGGAVEVTLSVLTKEPVHDLRVGFEGKEPSLEIKRVQLDEDGRRSVFSIRPMPERPIQGGEFALRIHRASSPKERVIVPVLVQPGGQT